MIQGRWDTVNHMCFHKDIKAVSFVGGSSAGKHIYKEASSTGKRC